MTLGSVMGRWRVALAEAGAEGAALPLGGHSPPGDVQLAEWLAIQEVGAGVGDVLGVALQRLRADVAQDFALLLNLLPDLQILETRLDLSLW